MNRHVPEEDIVLALLGGSPPAEGDGSEGHLATCELCAGVAATHRKMLEALSLPRPSAEAMQRVRDRLRQRVRLRRFLDRLLTDPAWQAQGRRGPRGAPERLQG